MMIKNNFKLALRSVYKNKIYSAINIFGLAIGIIAYLLITQYVNFEANYDRHLPHIDDLYRVTLSTNLGTRGFETAAATHPAVAYAMSQDFPEVESYSRAVDKEIMIGSAVLSYTNRHGNLVKSNINNDNVYFADNSIIELFGIRLTKGNPSSALKEKLTIILSTKLAERFFGDQDPINQILMANGDTPLLVTGVFEELQESTHFKFDMLVSFSTLGDWTKSTWNWPEFYNYVRLKPNTDPAILEAKFPAFVEKYLGTIMSEHNFEAKMGLQPVKDIHLKSHLANEIAVNSNEDNLHYLWIISLFVIFIALMNFINLSTAKSAERAKEVGLKKVVGIDKISLITQFLLESVLISTLAAFVSIIAICTLISPFNDLIGTEILTWGMWTEPLLWLHISGLVLVGGLLSGIYPAFVLSSHQPLEVLKGKYEQSKSGVIVRKILVVVQFSISIALISGTFVMYGQFSYMQNADLGFDSKHNLIVNAPLVVDSTINERMEVFKTEILRNPNINQVASVQHIPGKKNPHYNTTRQYHQDREASVICYQNGIDHDFAKTYQIEVVAGRNFRSDEQSNYWQDDPGAFDTPHRVMINIAAAKLLGYATPNDAIGKKIVFQIGPQDCTAEVIGVMENYHQQSLQNEYDPTVFVYPSFYRTSFLTFNINNSNIKNVIIDIGEKYESFFPEDPYDYFFLDEHFDNQYNADKKFGHLFLLFAGLAILIAALGLFGLGSYLTLRRTKELCIRKILGASTFHILTLIPRSLVVLVYVSGIIAVPFTYFLASNWLSNYAFKVDIGIWMLLAPIVLVIFIATLSVLPESIKVALLKPMNFLRND